MDADQIAMSAAEMWESLLSLAPGLRMVRKDGAYALINNQPSPVNGVYFERCDPDPAVVTALLDEVAASGLPYRLRSRPGHDETIARLAAGRGMTRADDLPLMLLETAPFQPPGPVRGFKVPAPVRGFEVRELAPAEAKLHVAVAAAGFGARPETVEQLAGPDMLGAEGVRCYLGELDGEPVATGMSVTFGSLTGLFSIATVPGQRGRGFGAAITARAVSDARAAGSPWCWLQSSPDGYRVYQGLGFRTIEIWATWHSPE